MTMGVGMKVNLDGIEFMNSQRAGIGYQHVKDMIAELRAAREVVAAAEQIEEFFGSDNRDRIEKALEKYRAVK